MQATSDTTTDAKFVWLSTDQREIQQEMFLSVPRPDCGPTRKPARIPARYVKNMRKKIRARNFSRWYILRFIRQSLLVNRKNIMQLSLRKLLIFISALFLFNASCSSGIDYFFRIFF